MSVYEADVKVDAVSGTVKKNGTQVTVGQALSQGDTLVLSNSAEVTCKLEVWETADPSDVRSTSFTVENNSGGDKDVDIVKIDDD